LLLRRCVRQEIKRLEEEVQVWEKLSRSVTGVASLPGFDEKTFALLEGRVTCFRMEKREVSVSTHHLLLNHHVTTEGLGFCTQQW
jgi:hypothetical protein